jgi:hypothetical protein
LTTLSAPAPARFNFTRVVEQVKRLSAAKAAKAIFRVDIDMARLLALN